MTIELRPVLQQDFDDWLRLRDAVYSGIDRAFHEQEMDQIFAGDHQRCLLAVRETGEVCGMIELSLRNFVDGCLTNPVGYVEGIYVDPAVRGQGVGRRLLSAGEAWCRSHGCREIATDAELDNEAAQRFHQHMGFEETYRSVQYRRWL